MSIGKSAHPKKKYKAMCTFLEFSDEWNFHLLFFGAVVGGTDESKDSTARG